MRRGDPGTPFHRYVTITCPHCAVAFVEIAADRLPTNKASECKKHLLRCESALAAGVCTNPVKRKRALLPPQPRRRVALASPQPRQATPRTAPTRRLRNG